ncbi:hypothetical protein LTR91_019607 [Friedmanniomyces endolithicus]|uniref:Uncharacterized protein n=1 Tax=Friedmanniomyces endolithicus TaxID=329885 RepID=A0AAN6H9B3_9PEZI|nr:hypothetical protein LTR57_023579 [Friedmanniomyces endolithicus]KAK0958861.1 hypothetical protein LTS01_021672 [Friedmanniomyces endolithicus]KAK0962100.1 hypothetical protein LTR91_019607 [Friedmanniomyces endolithicus]KAK1022901.1 hypothetical protein LTS16_025343 [Friedmanniomyces endolithicus]
MRLRDVFIQPRNQQRTGLAGAMWRPPASGHATARYGDLQSHPFATAPTARRTLGAIHGNAVPVTPERAARTADAVGSGRSVSVPQRQQKAKAVPSAVRAEPLPPAPASTIRRVDSIAPPPALPAPRSVKPPAVYETADTQTGSSRYLSATRNALENVSPRPSIAPARCLISPSGDDIVDPHAATAPRRLPDARRPRPARDENTNPSITPVTVTSYGHLCSHKLASHLAQAQKQPTAPSPTLPQLDGHGGGSHSADHSPSLHLTNHTYSNDTLQPRSLVSTTHPQQRGAPKAVNDTRLHGLIRAKGTWRTRMGRTRCWRCSLHDSKLRGWARLRRMVEWTYFCRFRAYEEDCEDEGERRWGGEDDGGGGHEMMGGGLGEGRR